MMFQKQKVLSRKDDWIEIETEDGPAILRGYDESLLEYESLDEAKAEKEAELIRQANEIYESIFTARIELDYILIRRIQGLPIGPVQQQKAADVLTLFEYLETKIIAIRQAQSEAEIQAEMDSIAWP